MDINKVAENLSKRGFIPFVCDTKEQAAQQADSLIERGVNVGFGGSYTVKEMDLARILLQGGREVYHSDFKDYEEVKYSGRFCEWYVSSVNAMTEQGDLVNIDGTGNRVAGTIFGAPNVLFVVGENKICEDMDKAIYRARNIAAPPNAVRLNRKTPCAVTGKCSYCNSPDCMCNATVILHHPMRNTNVYVILIKESLGY